MKPANHARAKAPTRLRSGLATRTEALRAALGSHPEISLAVAPKDGDFPQIIGELRDGRTVALVVLTGEPVDLVRLTIAQRIERDLGGVALAISSVSDALAALRREDT